MEHVNKHGFAAIIATSRTDLFLKVDIIDELPQATSFLQSSKLAPKKKKNYFYTYS